MRSVLKYFDSKKKLELRGSMIISLMVRTMTTYDAHPLDDIQAPLSANIHTEYEHCILGSNIFKVLLLNCTF